MKNISFFETQNQFRARTKHVTRRGNAKGPTWKNLRPGNQLMGCEKCQGLGKGGQIVRMGPITVLEVDREPLSDILRKPFRDLPIRIREQYPMKSGTIPDIINETVLEGFPEMSEKEFVEMFCKMNNCEPETEITRILFDYVRGAA